MLTGRVVAHHGPQDVEVAGGGHDGLSVASFGHFVVLMCVRVGADAGQLSGAKPVSVVTVGQSGVSAAPAGNARYRGRAGEAAAHAEQLLFNGNQQSDEQRGPVGVEIERATGYLVHTTLSIGLATDYAVASLTKRPKRILQLSVESSRDRRRPILLGARG